jgi:endonuclease YncB( thermonuclease family)
MEPKRRFVIAPETPGPDELQEMMEAKVTEVFDGDGFLAEVWHPHRSEWIKRVPFRFAFIDAPEMQQPFGPEAKAFLHDLIVGKTMRLDPIGKESTGYMPIDQYRRMLCMAYLTEEVPAGEIAYFMDRKCNTGVVKRPRIATRNVELEMIVNGWAWVTQQYAFDREEEYFAAQDDASRNRRGLWAQDDPEPPWSFKQKQKRRRKAAEGQPSLFEAPCPTEGCDGRLIERMGAHGAFWGCSNFPRCRFSQNP